MRGLQGVVLGGLLLAGSHRSYAQVVYRGMVGTSPVEVVLATEYGNEVSGVYQYTRINTPIKLSGKLQGHTLRLREQSNQGKTTATFNLPGYETDKPTLTGSWQAAGATRSVPVQLKRRYELPEGNSAAWQGQELLQQVSLPGFYFKAVLNKKAGELYPRLVEVKLLDKKTGQVVQRFEVDCEISGAGLNCVALGDFNFDGQRDFSVFEESYAGPNTSSLYFLYNPTNRRFEDSGFTGISLEFDAGKRRVYERNSCCAGTAVTLVEYKVAHNALVPLSQHCLKWSEKARKLVERPWEACQ